MIDNLERILTACDRNTLSGQRDYAILRLLIENSLKRQQVAAISIGDFDGELRSLQVQRQYKRQGQHTQPEIISLTLDTANALQDCGHGRTHRLSIYRGKHESAVDR